MTQPRKHHYLSQFYLRGFSVDGRSVYRIEKRGGRAYLSSIRERSFSLVISLSLYFILRPLRRTLTAFYGSLPSPCRHRSSSLLITPLRGSLVGLKVRCRPMRQAKNQAKKTGPRSFQSTRTDAAPFFVRYLRSDLKPTRTSSERSFGCSQAAKCPPLSSLL